MRIISLDTGGGWGSVKEKKMKEKKAKGKRGQKIFWNINPVPTLNLSGGRGGGQTCVKDKVYCVEDLIDTQHQEDKVTVLLT